MKNDNYKTIIKPICDWTANKIREEGKALDSKYQWQIKINQHAGVYKDRFLLNTYKEHARGVQGRMIPGRGTSGYKAFEYLGYKKGRGILEGVVPLHIKPSTCCDILANFVELTPCIYPVVSELILLYKNKDYTSINANSSKRATIVIKNGKIPGIQTSTSINSIAA